MEKLTGVVRTLGAENDAEIRALVVKTLATESAQAAGLACAQPLDGRSQDRLLVYGAGEGPATGLRARVVRVQGIGIADGPAALAPDLQPGELLALLDWSDAEEDALYLLTWEQVRAAWSESRRPAGRRRATPERWRALILEAD